VNPETRTLLENNPELRALYARHPRAVAALKKCASPCLPPHATDAQLTRFERHLDRVEGAGLSARDPAYQQRLKDWFHQPENMADIDGALARLEASFERAEAARQALESQASTGATAELPTDQAAWARLQADVRQAQAVARRRRPSQATTWRGGAEQAATSRRTWSPRRRSAHTSASRSSVSRRRRSLPGKAAG
jgi:hypothetical protein